MQVPPGVDRKILSYKGSTYWNVNAVVESFMRTTSDMWTPEAPKYDYEAKITLNLPCYSSQPGRKDMYLYDVLYNKEGINVDPYHRYCTEYKANEASQREKSDKGKRYLLPKSYLDDLEYLHDTHKDENYNDKFLPEINGPYEANKLRLTDVGTYTQEKKSRLRGEITHNGRKHTVVHATRRGNMRVQTLGFTLYSEGADQPEQTQKYDEQEKMEEFITLCARYMSHACNRYFGNRPGLVSLASKPKTNEMFRAEIDNRFFYNLLHSVQTDTVRTPYPLTAYSRTEINRVRQNLGENRDDIDQRWDAFKEAYDTIPKGRQSLRDVVCRRINQQIVKYYYAAEKKFRLVARVTRLVPGIGQTPALKL